MGRSTGGTPKTRALGAELREARNHAGMTIRDLAAQLGTNNAKLSRFETGNKAPAPEDVASILQALQMTGAERDRLIEMARDADESNWLNPGASTYQQELTTFMEFERAATKVFELCVSVLPGLLQTRDYARAVMGGMPPAEVETRVTLRIGRREVLEEAPKHKFTFVIAEGALREPLGGYAVLLEQLRQIVELCSKHSGVAVHVLPSGAMKWNPSHAGAFLLYDFEKASPIVHLEHYASSSFLHGAKTVEAYKQAVSQLLEISLGEGESVEFIEKCISEMEGSRI